MKAAFRLGGSSPAPAAAIALFSLLAWSLCGAAAAQSPALPAASAPGSATPTAAPPSAPVDATSPTEGVAEEQLRQLLVGKTFYLRGGYLGDSLNFNENGGIVGASPHGSYTLCLIEIDKVRLGKHKVELEGVRYGLHFLGALPSQDQAGAADRVRITPKKKVQRITIDRELVTKPKKVKVEKPPRQATAAAGNQQAPINSDADELKAEIAAAPAAERPADAASVTTTVSPAHAAQVLKSGLANIFAPGLDAGMIAAMPDFWKLYYQAAAAKTDYQPSDPAVLRQNTVDTRARLLSNIEPESNEYAQQAGVAGIALYHAVISAAGTAAGGRCRPSHRLRAR